MTIEENATMTVKEAAKILGKSPEFVREGLANGLLPFGTGFKLKRGSMRRCFVIYRKEFEKYVGELND